MNLENYFLPVAMWRLRFRKDDFVYFTHTNRDYGYNSTISQIKPVKGR